MEPSIAPDREGKTDGRRYWERLRLPYNLVLATIVLGWVVFRWPASRQLFVYPNSTRLLALAAFANLGYTFSWVIDTQFQLSGFRTTWLRGRIVVWVLGTLFAAAIAYFWMADEVLG